MGRRSERYDGLDVVAPPRTTASPAITRGAVVLTVLSGDYGKPRPALVVQSDLFNTTEQESVTVIPFTSTLVDAVVFRLTIEPSAANGLGKLSQLMVDKLLVARRDRIRATIGRLDDDAMLRVSRALAVWLGLA